MKHLFIALFFFLILCPAFGQNNIVKTAGVSYTAGAPTFTPGRTGSQVAIDTVTGFWYEHNGASWSASGYRVQTISGCAAPAYTPAKYQSRLVINACSAGQGGPELYYYTGSAWLQINEGQTYTAGTGIDITGATITNTAPNIVQTLSIAGQDLTLSGGGGTVAIPAGGSNMIADNYQLPGINLQIPAIGLAANESVTNYSFASVNPVFYKFNTVVMSATSTEYGGWLANGSAGDSIAVRAPYSVVIGDSQAEGHTNEHGRLHPAGVATYNATYADVYGTLSFKLRALTKMRWYNHGIGSESSTQIWGRWKRDVLAQNYNPGDGRGSRTLPAGTLPVSVIIIAGINDVGVVPVATTINNLENMARSARDNSISCVFLNIPGSGSSNNLAAYKQIDSLNTYFASGALQAYGATVFDYNKWWKIGATNWNDNYHPGAFIFDYVHPTRAGYDTLATSIFQGAKLPFLDSIIVYNEIGPGSFTGFSRPTGITLDTRTYAIPNTSTGAFKVNYGLGSDSIYIKITSSTNVSGTTYSGFSHIIFKVRNDTTGLFTRKQLMQGYQGYAGSLWQKSGSVINPTNTTDRVSIGTALANTVDTKLTIKSSGTGGEEAMIVQNSAGTTLFKSLSNGRFSIGGNAIGGYALSVNGDAIFGSASNQTYFNGGLFQQYGNAPQGQYQSSAVNTGGSGFTETAFTWNGADFAFAPHFTRGINNTFTWKNLAGSNTFRIDLANQGVINNVLGLGTTPNLSTGLILLNNSLAANNSQQISPMIRLGGQGWASSVGASRLVDFVGYVTPVQGASAPTGYFGLGSGVNSSYSYNQFIFTTDGQFGVGTVPVASAQVDIVSTTKGFLPPRMTTAQRDAIASPATGLTLYCTDCTATDTSTGVMQTYNGATWKNNW